MNIVIDASCLVINRHSGLSEVVDNLLRQFSRVRSEDSFTLFLNYFPRKGLTKSIPYPETTELYWKVPRRFIATWWRFGWPPVDICLNGIDVFHSPHIHLPPKRSIRTVLTVHDCRCLALSELYHPQLVENYRKHMETSLSRVDLVAAVSEFTRQEILTYFSFPEDRIRVIHNGFSPFRMDSDHHRKKADRFIESNNLPQSYLFYAGVLDPRKNLERLLEAIALCRGETQDFPDLVIAGVSPEQWAASDHADRAKELRIFDHIHPCGVIEKDVLVGLTKQALALCYPSLYEGFGFPPLEAMSVGVPVLAGRNSAIPEITGSAACLVDPVSVDDIARGLSTIVFDTRYRQALIESGYHRIQQFSWAKAAAEYMNLYRDALTV